MSRTDGAPVSMLARSAGRLRIVGVVLAGFLVAVVEVLFLPVRLGSVPVPLGALAAAFINPALVRAAAARSTLSSVAAAPLIAWVIGVVLTAVPGPGGDVILVGDWRALLLLGLGVIPAAIVLGVQLGRGSTARAQSTR